MPKSSASPKRVIAYVDGFNLYHGLKSAFGRRFLWLDLERLSHSLLLNGQTLLAVHYFTARVRNNPPGGARQKAYLDALSTRPLVVVHEGRFQSKQLACHSCGQAWQAYEEKETDVAIASRLIVDAAQSAMEVAMIMSADSDLIPAVKAARTVHPRLRLVAAFPPRRQSADLRNNVDASFHIGRGRIKGAQLPDTVELPDRELHRPKRWQ